MSTPECNHAIGLYDDPYTDSPYLLKVSEVSGELQFIKEHIKVAATPVELLKRNLDDSTFRFCPFCGREQDPNDIINRVQAGLCL